MKQLLILCFFLCSTSLYAQDVIVKNDGTTIVCRVIELNATEIVYKKWSDLKGSNYVMDRSLASTINYENGKKVNLSDVSNTYKAGNQNDGEQRYNDKALLKMDYAASQPLQTVKKIKTIGWVTGIVGVGVGAAFLAMASKSGVNYNDKKQYTIGGVACAIGITGFTVCQLIANKKQKLIEQMLQTSVVYQKNLYLGNGSVLSAGVDMMKDNVWGYSTLGLGVRYNF